MPEDHRKAEQAPTAGFYGLISPLVEKPAGEEIAEKTFEVQSPKKDQPTEEKKED